MKKIFFVHSLQLKLMGCGVALDPTDPIIWTKTAEMFLKISFVFHRNKVSHAGLK